MENNLNLYGKNHLTATVKEFDKIFESLNLLGIGNENKFEINNLFAIGYIDKIIGNEDKLLELQEIGFIINKNSLIDLCDLKKETIISIEKYFSLKEKLLEFKDLEFSFDGHNFYQILNLNESIIDKIIYLKPHLLKLVPIGVKFDLLDLKYFDIDEELVIKLANISDKLNLLTTKIGLRLSLRFLSKTNLKLKSEEKLLAKTKSIVGEKAIQQERVLNILRNEENRYENTIKPGKEVSVSVKGNQNENMFFLEDFDIDIFDKVVENLDLIQELFNKIHYLINPINEFLELSYLFDKPDLIKNIIKLIDGGINIGLNDLKSRKELFENLDYEVVGYSLKLKQIHSDYIPNFIYIITNITKNKENVKTILENEEKYRKLISIYKDLFGSEEILFKNGIFNKNIIEILENDNFVELEIIFKELKLYTGGKSIYDEIFYDENLAFVMKFTQGNKLDLAKFFIVYFGYNFDFKFIEFLQNQNIINLKEFLKGINKEFLLNYSEYCNELVLLLEEFGFEVSKDIKKITYAYNIIILLSGSEKLSNITSLNQIFNKLSKTGFQEGKITKENIVEIGALINSDFEKEGQAKDSQQVNNIEFKILEIKAGNNIETYKKIVRALGEYMYSRDFEEDFAFQDLLKIFGKTFNSEFLKSINTGSETFKYLLSKKVRLQDIEKIYNNHQSIFMLEINNEFNKFCIDYTIENDNYDYLAQNIGTIRYLIVFGFFEELLLSGKDKTSENNKSIDNVLSMLSQILDFTGGYLTISMVKGYIEEGKNLEELLEESKQAKKEVLSPNPITHLNLATYETIFLAYRPTGFTIETIKQNIENGNIADLSHHLEGIKYNSEGYDMDFFQRSYSLKGEQDKTVLDGIDSLLRGYNAIYAINEIKEGTLGIDELLKGNISYNIFNGLKLKSFFSTSTNIFGNNQENGKIEINQGIVDILKSIYALSDDVRIKSYRDNFFGDTFNYERLLELQEIFSVVTKDSFEDLISKELEKITDEKKETLWQQIGKLKDKKVLAKFSEIDKKNITIGEKIKEIFMWRFLEYAKLIRKYINNELNKFKEIKGKEVKVKAVLSKNIGSFFAKAGAGLCTSENYEMWKEDRHIHLNLIDEQKQEIIGNIMLYFEPGRNYLITRGFNPRIDIESAYEVNHMVDEMIRVVKEIAVQNGFVDKNGEALVYIPPQDSTHLVSNREKVRKRMKYIVGKVGEEINDTNFSANRELVRVCNTLHRI